MENHQYKFALRYMLTSEYDMLEVNFANECVQQRLACSVGDSPTGVKASPP